MPNDDFNDMIDRFTRGIVRRKVKQLIGRAGFTHQDREDLEQEFFARVLQSLHSFDPAVAHRNKFITTVVERHVANVLRNKQAEKRDHRRVTSLNVRIGATEGDSTEPASALSERDLGAHLGRDRRTEVELCQLRMDLDVLLVTMPEPWRTLLELRKTRTMSEVAQQMGVPRTTLSEWMRRIRRRFEKAGMEEYLK